MKHKGNEMEFLPRFVPHIPIYNSYRGKLVGEELVSARTSWGRGEKGLVRAENRDSWGEDRWKECIGGVAGTGHQPA